MSLPGPAEAGDRADLGPGPADPARRPRRHRGHPGRRPRGWRPVRRRGELRRPRDQGLPVPALQRLRVRPGRPDRRRPAARATGRPAPTLRRPPRRHFARLGANDSLTLRWDASGVPGASGARLEVSAAGPTIAGAAQHVQQPGRDRARRQRQRHRFGGDGRPARPGRDDDVHAAELGLYSTMRHGVRVLAVDAQGNVVGSAGAVSSLA